MRAGRPRSQEMVSLLNPGICGCRSLPGFLASELILWIRLRKTQKRRAAKPPGADAMFVCGSAARVRKLSLSWVPTGVERSSGSEVEEPVSGRVALARDRLS